MQSQEGVLSYTIVIDLHDVKHKTILYENNKLKKKKIIELPLGQIKFSFSYTIVMKNN